VRVCFLLVNKLRLKTTIALHGQLPLKRFSAFDDRLTDFRFVASGGRWTHSQQAWWDVKCVKCTSNMTRKIVINLMKALVGTQDVLLPA